MSADELTSPLFWHYGIRLDALVRGMTALTDVWELIPDYDQLQLLDLLLPGVTDAHRCWEELGEPLEHLARLDAITAYEELREQGVRGPLDRQDAYDRVRTHLEHEIADVISQYRTPALAVTQ